MKKSILLAIFNCFKYPFEVISFEDIYKTYSFIIVNKKEHDVDFEEYIDKLNKELDELDSCVIDYRKCSYFSFIPFGFFPCIEIIIRKQPSIIGHTFFDRPPRRYLYFF